MLFDYWMDSQALVESRFLASDKKQYILSSHVHHDHFSPELLTWKKQFPSIQLILSDDILHAKKAKQEDAFFMAAYETYTDELLTVRSFGSTDEGVSFVIEAEGKSILFAGDLNNWHWQDDGNKEYSETAEKDYERKLAILQEAYPMLDVAIFPVDKRMGSDYDRGARQLLDSIKVGCFVPMHFEPDYECAQAFETVTEKAGVGFFRIENRGDSMEIG